MKPRGMLCRVPSPKTQLLLPLHAVRIFVLDSCVRAGVVAALARLLLEAARPPRRREGRADAE